MLKNVKKSNKVENKYGEIEELGCLTISHDGASKTLQPGECVDLVNVFNVSKQDAVLLEARFLNKFPREVAVVDSVAEQKKIDSETIEKQKKEVDAAETADEVEEIITNSKFKVVINYGIQKMKALVNRQNPRFTEQNKDKKAK